VIVRLLRNTALACLASSVAAALWTGGDVRVVGGVLAGGLLVTLAIWALAGLVGGVAPAAESGEIRPVSRGFALVKFFTRHAILAFVAYVMMIRLHLDPVGMVVGVTSVVVAAVVEAARPR
jgi:hypothetical protein